MKKTSFGSFTFLVICVFLLSSCFTGKVYHHSRVSVEPTPSEQSRKNSLYSLAKKDSSEVAIRPSIADSSVAYHSNLAVEQNKTVDSHPSKRPNIIPKYKLKKSPSLPNAIQRRDLGDAFAGFFAILFFLVIGIPSIALLVTGFLLGLGGIMVGFWICWVLGMLGVTFASVLWIIVWADVGGDILPVLSSIFYVLLFLMAIAFILIVLI